MTIDTLLALGLAPMGGDWAHMELQKTVGIPIPGSRARHGSGGSAASSPSSGKCSPLFALQLDGTLVTLTGHPLARACAQQVQPKPLPTSRYKTELCRPYEENGYCKYGDKCQFAHGGHEQRSLSRHPKYKTELCRTFHTVGFCPYGPRCHFIHNEDERKLGHINQMRHHQVIQQVAQHQQMLSQMAVVPTAADPIGRLPPSAAPTSPQRARFQPIPMSPLTSPTMSIGQIPSPTFQFHMLQPKSLDFNSDASCFGSMGDTPPITPTPMMSDPLACLASQKLPKPMSPDPFTSLLSASSLKLSQTNSMPTSLSVSVSEKANPCDLLKGIFSSPPTPPSSDEESCSSLDATRSVRLPIFSRFTH